MASRRWDAESVSALVRAVSTKGRALLLELAKGSPLTTADLAVRLGLDSATAIGPILGAVRRYSAKQELPDAVVFESEGADQRVKLDPNVQMNIQVSFEK